MFSERNNTRRRIRWSARIPAATRFVVILCTGWVTGCTTLAGINDLTLDSDQTFQMSDEDETSSNVSNSQLGREAAEPSSEERTAQTIEDPKNAVPVPELSFTEKSQQLLMRLTGQEQDNNSQAREWYQNADKTFKTAIQQPSELAAETYIKAAKLFEQAGEMSPKTALQQDAMFMQGESLFFANRLVEASEVYEHLQKTFPRNRHLDKVAARLFSISQYWIKVSQANQANWLPINLTDPKRPRLDAQGHAIRVLDQIRFDDPTGRLADDSTMAAAVEYMRQEKYQEADEFLTDLRETFTDSEHLFMAHLLGVDVKLQTYRGPKYSGLALEEAEKLAKHTRERFPDKLSSPEDPHSKRLSELTARIGFLQAERLRYRAEYREKRKEFGAARFYYNQLLTKYPDTPHAKKARERLEATEQKPLRPAQRLSWLTTIFPDSTAADSPLELNQPIEADSTSVIRR